MTSVIQDGGGQMAKLKAQKQSTSNQWDICGNVRLVTATCRRPPRSHSDIDVTPPTRSFIPLKPDCLQGQHCVNLSISFLNFSAFWKILMEGPPDTPYERGTFELFCQFGSDYPVKPPLVRFVTRVSFTGNVHLYK